MVKKICFNLLVVLFLLMPLLTAEAAPAAQGGNLVPNGDFETADTGSSTGLTNWVAWWIEEARPTDGSLNYSFKPNGFYKEYQPNGAAFIHTGGGSLTIRNNWDPWTGGAKQVVSAPAGSRVRLTAYAHLWASQKDWNGGNTPSDATAAAISRVGIDPNGTDYPSSGSQVVWSGTVSPHDTWQPVSVDATVGASGRVTVILYTSYRGYSRNFMTGSWDDASLVVVSATGPTAAPGATAAPAAATQAPAAPVLPAFVMPTAQSDGSVIYVVQPGDSLWRIAANTGLTIDQIKAMNGLTANMIAPGQRLIIGQGATATPAPTIEPTVDTNAPTATVAAPEAAITPTATAAAAGAGTSEICALLYNDANGNGVQDAQESAITGGQLALLDANTGAPVQAYTTVAEDVNGHCFKDLPAGTYTVVATAPAGYNPTTATTVSQKAETGLHYKLQFGAQLSANAPATTAGGGKSNLRTALFGAAGVVLLLLAAGVAGFLVLRRR